MDQTKKETTGFSCVDTCIEVLRVSARSRQNDHQDEAKKKDRIQVFHGLYRQNLIAGEIVSSRSNDGQKTEIFRPTIKDAIHFKSQSVLARANSNLDLQFQGFADK